MKKRLLSVLLVLCMVFTMMPIGAFATGGNTPTDYGDFSVSVVQGDTAPSFADGVLTIASAGEYTVAMKKDVPSTSHRIAVTASGVTLNIDGVTISTPQGAPTSDGVTALTVTNGTILNVIANSSFTGGVAGPISSGGNPRGGAGIQGNIVVKGSGTLTATGGSGNGFGSPAGYGIFGDVDVSGGVTLIAQCGSGEAGMAINNGVNSGGTITVADGYSVWNGDDSAHTGPLQGTSTTAQYVKITPQIIRTFDISKGDIKVENSNTAGKLKVSYTDTNGTARAEDNINPADMLTITQTNANTTPTEHKIGVTAGTSEAPVNITFDGVNILTNDNPFKLNGTAVVNLILKEGTTNTLQSNANYKAALNVQNDGTSIASITISGSGTLTANGGSGGAGIGGDGKNAGKITISGHATVHAKGGNYGAGIGGGFYAGGGTITISDSATVTATGGFWAAGIGGGGKENGAGGTVIITGGTVTATGGEAAAGIGGGKLGAGGTVTISGGNVTVKGGAIGAGNAFNGTLTATNMLIKGGSTPSDCTVIDVSTVNNHRYVKITPPLTADFTIPENQNKAYAESMFGAGKATWAGDASGYTLTLNEVSFSTSAPIAMKLPDKTTVVSTGTNVITSTYSGDKESNGINVDGSVTFRGKGTLTATGGSSQGASSYGVSTWTIEVSDGTVKGIGGAVTKDGEESVGIRSTAEISIANGILEGVGGTASGESGTSCGVSSYEAPGIELIDGTLKGTGGSSSGLDGISTGISCYQGSILLTPTGKGSVWATGNTYGVQGNSRFGEPLQFASIKGYADYNQTENLTVAAVAAIDTNYATVKMGADGSGVVAKTVAINVVLPTAAQYSNGTFDGTAAASGTDYVLDTNAKTLHIKTAKGAAWWSANGSDYRDYALTLENDIDVSAFLWTPVGNSSNNFTGSFDGQNHTIKGMKMDVNASGNVFVGLFGFIKGTSGNPVSIKNIGIVDSSVKVTTSGTAIVGGIAGVALTATFTNCYNSGSLSCTAGSAFIGGIVGQAHENCTVSNCYNTGNISVTTTYNAGGIAGIIAGGGSLTNCYNSGNISDGHTNNGSGIAGRTIASTISNCYYLRASAEKGIGSVVDSTATGCGTFVDNGGALTAGTTEQFGGSEAQSLTSGNDLLNAMNSWVDAKASTNNCAWKADNTTTPVNGGYPVFGAAWAASHAHCVCGGTTNIGDHTNHNNTIYTPIPSNFAGGYLENNIYLDRDVTLTSSLNVASGKTLNLCLNGYKLTANGGAFSVIKNSGTLNICDCNKSCQNSINSYAWDEINNVWKAPETITVQGGVITGGNAPSGGSEAGGGGICNLGTLRMYSGTISGNRAATYGAGVHNLGSMVLYGGSIQNNAARSVSGSNSFGTGGGIYTKKLTDSIPSLILYGGSITKNLAGNNGAGVFAGEGASVSLAGNTEIYENINASTSANLYVDRNSKLKVTGTLQNTHPIGVNLWTPGVFTENGGGFTGKVSDQLAKFTSDTSDYRVVADGNQLRFLELYAITPSVSTNGSYTVKMGGREVTSAVAGETVTITPTANSGYAVDTVTVKQTESPNAAVTDSNNTFTMPTYAVTVTVTFKAIGGGSSGGSGGGGGGGGTTTTPTAPVIVGGKTENIGKSETTTSETKVTVDSDKLTEKVNASETGGSVQVPVSDSKAAATAGIVVKNVESMAKKNMTLEVKSGAVSYQLPTTAIDTAAVMAELGATDTSKVPLNVTIKKLDESTVKVEDGNLIVPPVSFTITATYGGKTVEVKDFSQYVQRSIEITKEQAAQITTAVVQNEDGSLRHVPTYVYQKDGKWFATINSRTNSTYALIRNEATFADAHGKWYESIVSEMASRKIINGKSESSFDGDASITRAEFAAIVIRALGLSADGKCSFTDVKTSDWYYGAIGTAVKYGLVNGYTNGSFAPNADISRQEAMAMVQRAAKVAEYTGTNGKLTEFKDSNEVSAWAKSAAEFNVGSGLIVGSNGALRPGDKISRAETATVILRLLQKAELVDVRSKI